MASFLLLSLLHPFLSSCLLAFETEFHVVSLKLNIQQRLSFNFQFSCRCLPRSTVIIGPHSPCLNTANPEPLTCQSSTLSLSYSPSLSFLLYLLNSAARQLYSLDQMLYIHCLENNQSIWALCLSFLSAPFYIQVIKPFILMDTEDMIWPTAQPSTVYTESFSSLSLSLGYCPKLCIKSMV